MARETKWGRDGADGEEGRASASKQRLQMVMRLRMVRGSLHIPESDTLQATGTTEARSAAEAAAATVTNMDEKVWSSLPDDILWEVLVQEPAAKRYQFQLVSRKWRQVLTSPDFRRKVAARQRQGLHARQDSSVVACLVEGPGGGYVMPRADIAGVGDSDDVEIDFSFVSSGFWPQPQSGLI